MSFFTKPQPNCPSDGFQPLWLSHTHTRIEPLNGCFPSCWTWGKKTCYVFLAKGLQPHLPTVTNTASKKLPGENLRRNTILKWKETWQNPVVKHEGVYKRLRCPCLEMSSLYIEGQILMSAKWAEMWEFTNPAGVVWSKKCSLHWVDRKRDCMKTGLSNLSCCL